jgi:CPA1 family monovalent cation:H+ antiporter
VAIDLPVVIELVVAAVVVAIAAKRARIPYNVALVVGGLLIDISQVLPTVPTLDPGVVFLLALPALLFEGGISADAESMRENAMPIGVLASLGMGLAIGGTGTALHFLLGLPWGPAFLLGAILSVTDTVSILLAFRRQAVPRRLSGIMEGESLFNDGTALVAYGAILTLVVSGGSVSIPQVAARAGLATAGGLGIGVAVGLVVGALLRQMQDPLAEIMATSAAAYASYLVAERLGVSGVIAAVTAGLVVGGGLRRWAAPQSRIAIGTFWEYVAFGVNTFLFLALGLTTAPATLLRHVPETLLAMLALFAGRALAVYLPFALIRWSRPPEAMPLRWQHVFVIGNVKGALSVALALGLPAAVPGREQLIGIVFGVTLVSLVGQGLLLPRALRSLGLVEEDPAQALVGAQQGRLLAARAARTELEGLHAAGFVPRDAFERLRSDYQVVISGAERELRRLHERHLTQGAKTLLLTRRRLVDAERSALLEASRAGLVAPPIAERLLAELDERVLALERVMAGAGAETVEGRGGRGP